MFDLYVNTDGNIYNKIFMISSTAFLILALFIAFTSGTKEDGTPKILGGAILPVIAGIAVIVMFTSLPLSLNKGMDNYDKVYNNNISRIESAGVIVTQQDEGDIYDAFTRPNYSADITLTAPGNKLLSCKILTSANMKTFDVQCLDPLTAGSFVPLNEIVQK